MGSRRRSHVPSAVKFERRLKVDGSFDVPLRLRLRERLLGGVEGGDVSLVVLRVVERHDLGGDGGFEGLSGARRQELPSEARRHKTWKRKQAKGTRDLRRSTVECEQKHGRIVLNLKDDSRRSHTGGRGGYASLACWELS